MSSQRPTTDDEFHQWVNYVLGFNIARHVTKAGHRSPFEFIADAFFERERVLVARGNRGAGKTRLFSIFDLASMRFKPGYSIVNIAGSEGQARDGYAYFAGSKEKDGVEGLIKLPFFADMLAAEPMVTKCVLTNGSKLEIRTGGSERSVSGPHPHALTVDELDHIDTLILATAMQMPMSSDQYQATTLMASSQYHSTGTMQSFLDTAEEKGIAVYEFDIFDTMKPCGRAYPIGCGGCPLQFWTNPYTGNYEELCGGRGEKAEGHYPYQDVCSKFLTTDAESFALQNLLLTGKQQGLVYPQYDMGCQQPFPPEGADINNWTCFAGVDQRGRGRIVVVAQAPGVLENGKRLRWVIAEWDDNNNTPSKLIQAAHEMKARIIDEFGLHISVFWAEKAAQDLIGDWPRDLNCRTIPKEVANVAYGIGVLRDAFRDNSNTRSLFIDTERCPELHTAIAKKFKCKRMPDGSYDRDTPGKDGEDYPTALRYAYVGGPMRVSTVLPQAIVISGGKYGRSGQAMGQFNASRGARWRVG